MCVTPACVSGIHWADFPGKRSEGSPGPSGVVLRNYPWRSPMLFFQAVFSQKEDFYLFWGGEGGGWRKDITVGYSLCFHVKEVQTSIQNQ